MLNIYAPINMLGYGMHANNMIKSFIDTNIDINLTTIGQIQNDPYYESYWKMADKNRLNYDAKAPSLYIFHDELSNQAAGAPLYVFSVFETTKLKELSLRMLKNGPADVILTTTKEHKKILEANDIGKPVHVLNEGVDDIIFNTIPVDKHIDTGKFTYITVGKKEKRKNTDLILRSFMELMSDKDVAMLAHTFNPFANKQNIHPFKNLESWADVNPAEYGFEYKEWNGKAHKFSKGNCDLYFTAPGIQTAEMGCLYHSANVGIQISRGEGWDLPLSEMLACGLPCIATDCLGHSEYLNDNLEGAITSVPIIGQEEARDDVWFKGNAGDWGIVDEDCFKDTLKLTWDDREKYTEKSEAISTYMADNYSWTKAAQDFNKLLG